MTRPFARRSARTIALAALGTALALAAAADAQTVRFSGGERGMQRQQTIAAPSATAARLWFNERNDEAFARAFPVGGVSDGAAIGSGLTVIADGELLGPLSAIRPRDDAMIFNPEPAGARGVVRFRGSDIGSVQRGGSGARFFTNSPTRFGAPADELGQIIWVRTRDALPPIAISPWQDITEANVDALIRLRPSLRTVNPRDLLSDLEIARRQWLRENGYLSPRTFVNRSPGAAPAREGEGGARNDAVMHNVRQIIEQRRAPAAEPREPATELGEDSFIRVNNAPAPRNDRAAADDAGESVTTDEAGRVAPESEEGLGEGSFIRVNTERRDRANGESRQA